MLNCLNELLKKEENASIYFNSNSTDNFAFGKILSIDETNVEMYLISPDGDFDGIIVKPIDDIVRIEVGGQYSEKMAMLMKSFSHNPKKYALKKSDQNSNLFTSLLNFASENDLITSIELLNSGYDDVVGFVKSVGDQVCKIEQIDEYGFEDGSSLIRIDDITQLCCESQDERRIARLWQSHK